MSNHQKYTLAALLTSLGLGLPVHAADRTAQASAATAIDARALTPAQLAAIRGISRSVLAAKKSSAEDGADAAFAFILAHHPGFDFAAALHSVRQGF
jgi:hypothetical protein